jgi:perosamine synthetase
MYKIPVSKPFIGEREKEYAMDAIQSGWVSSKGAYITRFEDAWADKNFMDFGVACSSGTNAIFLALRALGIKEGDEVIVPDFTMVATAWAVTYLGAKPVFVDCNDSLLIDVDRIEEKITHKTRAIIAVHIYGRQCDMLKIMNIAWKHHLKVVEDSAEAHGILPMGDIACFSLFGNKIITTGEGGICLTDNYELAERMMWYRSMCFDPKHTFLHADIGYNHRMTNVQGAIGLGQVENFDEILKRRQEIAEMYDKMLPSKVLMPKRDVVWVYDVDCGDRRDEIKEKLEAAGIETRYFFKPMSVQPMYKGSEVGENALKWSERGLYLPVYPEMTREDVEFICNEFKKAWNI